MRSRCRTTLRVTAVLAPTAITLGGMAPAVADRPITWPDPEPMSTLHALLLYVGVPAGLFVLIALLVMAPSVTKGPRYRPGLSWWATPEWFGGPPARHSDDRPALERGPSSPAGATAISQVELSDATLTEGGASARW